MGLALLALAVSVAAACTNGSDQEAAAEPADRFESGPGVVVNARVYTGVPDQSWAEAFAFDADGVITAVGSTEVVLAGVESDTPQIDANGHLVLAGFQDAHVHVPEAGINTSVCLMPARRSLTEYENLARRCAADQPESEWVLAAGPALFELRDTNELPVDVLDRAVPDRPALILDDLGHAVWTNSLGLEAAGIGPNDPDPRGGVLHRTADGELTGLLLENAQQLVRNAATLDDGAIYDGLLTALEDLAKNGVTSVSDAGGYWAQNHDVAWVRTNQERTQTVRAANSLYVYPDLDAEEQLAELGGRFSDTSDMLRFDTAKIYVDGILDLGTALLLDPYDRPIDSNYPNGFSYFSDDKLKMYVLELHAMGFRINFHAIGDDAVRQALDSVESIPDEAGNVASRRHRITHAYIIHPDDLPRFAELGVVADLQQSPDAIDPDYHAFLTDFVGGRSLDLIPTGHLLDAGAEVILSSDWDAGPLPPLGTIQRAISRRSNGIRDIETAVAMSTIEPARALGHSDTTGTLEVGKFADFVVLDQDIFEIPTASIQQTNVLATFVGGSAVFWSPDFSG